MQTLRRPLLLGVLALLSLTACSGIRTQTPVTSACTAFPRISFDRLNDTLDTIRQVKAYDAARNAVCGVGK